ncbi:MAG: GH92 family glycosyl hydrolase [Marinilabiliales bacterium]|nr:GH92 family glycosyl hydrolase [Marinilabiliales bacterium]
MKFKLLTLLWVLSVCPSMGQKRLPVDYVNPFIGTGGEMDKGFGNVFPGAAYPFGMIQLSPDNGGQNWQYSGGYHYPDSLIAGFSHTHLSGTGVADFCDISVMPTLQPIEARYFEQENATVEQIIHDRKMDPMGFVTRDGHKGAFDKHFLLNYSSFFQRKTEKASPGYYAVVLNQGQIRVELTTGELAAMHRYTFPGKNGRQHLILNLGFVNTDRTLDAALHIHSDHQVTGFRRSAGKTDHTVYFAMEFSRPMVQHLFFLASEQQADQASGNHLAAALSFDGKESDQLLVRVAISSVSEEGALNNLKSAAGFGWDFDKMHQSTRDHWNRLLSAVAVEGSDPVKKSIFYTALYHSYLAPYRYSDVDGRYRNFRKEIDRADGYTHYHLLSLWDTFRAENPLLLLMQPKIAEDIIHSMLAKYRQTGELPYWEISCTEGGSMIGYHAAVLMADALSKNVGTFDRQEIFKALMQVSHTDRKGLGFYRKYHYVPTDLEKSGTVSKTLEYSYDDWCIAQVAKWMGKEQEYKEFMERSGYYRNLFDPAFHLFRGKNSDGSWYEPFQPRFADYGNPHCVEGNTWQYSFFAPHDPEGLIRLMGGQKGMERMLDSLFNQTSELLGEETSDVTGLIGQYAHGNEPSHHVAYLYNLVGQPHKTQKYVSKILNTLYSATPDGLCGNEDCGQMSAWYVFSALGFYPVNPVDGRYQIGSPQFDRAVLHLPNGKTFTLQTHDLSPASVYIKRMTLNGKPLTTSFVTYEDLQSGGVLECWMSDRM